jgi:urease accessory protein
LPEFRATRSFFGRTRCRADEAASHPCQALALGRPVADAGAQSSRACPDTTITYSAQIPTDDRLARLNRARGAARLGTWSDAGVTRIRDLRQSGSLKVMFPRIDGSDLQAVLVNTAGGLTAGDRFEAAIAAGPGARLALTTQAAERAYRARDLAPARVRNTLRAGAGADLMWLPQETILFNGCALDRRMTVDLDPQARLVLVEPLVFGRMAMGESVATARVRDRIEIRRDGRCAYLDALSFGPDVTAQMARTFGMAGARALATLIVAGPTAEGWLTPLREMLPDTGGASLAADDLLVARILAADGFDLRRTLVPILTRLTQDRLPRPWML